MTPFYWISKLKRKKRKNKKQDSICKDEQKRIAQSGVRLDEATQIKSPSISFDEECWLADQILKRHDDDETK